MNGKHFDLLMDCLSNESEARQLICDVNGDSQWSPDIPSHEVAKLCVLLSIRKELQNNKPKVRQEGDCCGNCEFFMFGDQCHRYPQESIHGQYDGWWEWRPANENDWCGEHQLKQKEEDKDGRCND